MLERRTLLAGFAALPAAGLPLAAMASARPDLFAACHAEVLALHAAMNALPAGSTDADMDVLMDRWGAIDEQVLARQPNTLAGALGALEYARREFHQFHVEAEEHAGDNVCPGDRLVLHLLDGALAVLRQATGGGVA